MYCVLYCDKISKQQLVVFECSSLFVQVKKEDTGTIHVIKQKQLQLGCDIISLSVSP